MGIREQLNEDLKEAMRGGDVVRRTVIRGVLTSIKESEQKSREELVKKALKKHNIERPSSQEAADMAAYNAALDRVMAEENVEAQATLSETDLLSLIQKLVKQREDSIQEAEGAGRNDVVESQRAEMVILASYLPKQMSRQEIEAEARQIIAETGASGSKDMGKVMGPLNARLKGRADGRVISDVVKGLLGG